MIKLLREHLDILVSIGILGIVAILIIPIHQSLLDVLLAFNITLSIIIFIVAIYIQRPLEFSIFPGILLIVTLFRLALNVSSTRLILGEANAGKIIQSFGSFVIKGNYIVGIMIFIILVLINFIVITKGATRISEVAARFTLDSTPGKQMAIDADLNNGLIDEKEARERRKKIAEESEFFGAMDGASKFIRGDAIAGIIITFINIIAGLAIGILQKGFSMQHAIQTYTMLTVGDGLVAQIPALIISTSAALVITRTSSDKNISSSLIEQLINKPTALFIASGVVFFFGIVPGMPFLPFFFLSIITATVGYLRQKRIQELQLEAPSEVPEVTMRPAEVLENYLQVDPISIDLGYNLIPLVTTEEDGDLTKRIPIIRKQFALDLGIILPYVRIRDNIQLNPDEYTFNIRGNEVARNVLKQNFCLAIESKNVTETISGEETIDPTYGLPALWIPKDKIAQANKNGYITIDHSEIITTHFMEILNLNAHKLISRDIVNELIENLKKVNPKLVEELIPSPISYGLLQKVLRMLVAENIPIKDLGLIVESISDLIKITQDAELITEGVRNNLKETIAQRFKDKNGIINAYIFDSKLEQYIGREIQKASTSGISLTLQPSLVNNILKEAQKVINECSKNDIKPIIIVGPNIRRFVWNLISTTCPQTTILSYGELPAIADIKSIGMIKFPIPDEATNKNRGNE